MDIQISIRIVILLYLSGIDISDQIVDLDSCIREVKNIFSKISTSGYQNEYERIKAEIFNNYIEGYIDFSRKDSLLIIKVSEKGKSFLRENSFIRFVFDNFP